MHSGGTLITLRPPPKRLGTLSSKQGRSVEGMAGYSDLFITQGHNASLASSPLWRLI